MNDLTNNKWEKHEADKAKMLVVTGDRIYCPITKIICEVIGSFSSCMNPPCPHNVSTLCLVWFWGADSRRFSKTLLALTPGHGGVLTLHLYLSICQLCFLNLYCTESMLEVSGREGGRGGVLWTSSRCSAVHTPAHRAGTPSLGSAGWIRRWLMGLSLWSQP